MVFLKEFFEKVNFDKKKGDEKNQEKFPRMQRVAFVMFQGFSVEGQENIQEILSKQLYLCQFLVAISIIRPGEVLLDNLKTVHPQFSCLYRLLVKSAYQKINFLISQPNHMLWVLKRTVPMRRFF